MSYSEDFGATNNIASYSDFWVSDLAIVNRHDYGNPQMAGMVTDNRTGEPVGDAKVQVWTRGQNGGWGQSEASTTDKNGLVRDQHRRRPRHMVVVSTKDQQLSSAGDWYTWQNARVEARAEQTVFFADRSLYRPGQTIQFKGIAISWNHGDNNYTTVANRDVEVIFADVNGKEIARHKTKSNDYGSFSGSFTAPRDRLMGRMSLHTANNNGYAWRHGRGIQLPEVQGRSRSPEGRWQAQRHDQSAQARRCSTTACRSEGRK